MIYLLLISTEEDKRKFVILYEKYKYLMLKVANDVLDDSFLAEDAIHDTFIKIAIIKRKKQEEIYVWRKISK